MSSRYHLNLRAMYSGTRCTGVFCCVLPDASSVTQMQCVEIGIGMIIKDVNRLYIIIRSNYNDDVMHAVNHSVSLLC